jgi:hypothetical protein
MILPMHPKLLRALAGAVMGAGLVLAWWAIFTRWPSWPLRLTNDRECQDMGCALGGAFASLLIMIPLVIALTVTVGWIVLRAIRVRPAWPIAVVGPVLGWVLVLLAGGVIGEPTVWWQVAAFAVGYGFAGLLSAPRAA